MEENWVLLSSYQNPNVAALAKALLEENGIQVVEINKRDSSYGLFGLSSLYCHIDQAHDAFELLNSTNDE